MVVLMLKLKSKLRFGLSVAKRLDNNREVDETVS